MHSREHLDRCLSRTMNIPLHNGRLRAIDDAHYVLTLDYTIKMLSIHERCRCGVPVIIQGETGVGKTALVKMLSDLWNYSYNQEWRIEKSRLCEFIVSQSKVKTCATDKYMVIFFVVYVFVNEFLVHYNRSVLSQYKRTKLSVTMGC